jgi:hypothetical protein
MGLVVEESGDRNERSRTNSRSRTSSAWTNSSDRTNSSTGAGPRLAPRRLFTCLSCPFLCRSDDLYCARRRTARLVSCVPGAKPGLAEVWTPVGRVAEGSVELRQHGNGGKAVPMGALASRENCVDRSALSRKPLAAIRDLLRQDPASAQQHFMLQRARDDPHRKCGRAFIFKGRRRSRKVPPLFPEAPVARQREKCAGPRLSQRQGRVSPR